MPILIYFIHIYSTFFIVLILIRFFLYNLVSFSMLFFNIKPMRHYILIRHCNIVNFFLKLLNTCTHLFCICLFYACLFYIACFTYFIVLMLIQFCSYNLISSLILFFNVKPICYHIHLNS